MANLFNCKNEAEYSAATDRPVQQSSVSYDGTGVISDGKNILLPFNETNCEVGDMVVFDTVENKRKILKSKTYYAGTFDSSRYIKSKGLYFGSTNGKGLFVAYEDVPGPSQMWAEKCYFRLTGLDLTQAGSITFNTYYSLGAHNGNVVSWSTGATLASVVATFNGLGLSASYFKVVVLADSTGIGIWVNFPTISTIASIFSITASSGGGTGATVEYMNKIGGNDVVFQYVETSTVISSRAKAANIRRRNGLVTSYAGAHEAKFIDFCRTGGSSIFVPESNATPMTEACFNSLSGSSVPAELALYNKYVGNYTKYIEGAMAANPSAYGVMGLSYDDGAVQTALLGKVMTKDYDNNIIPAFPAAYNVYHYGVNAGVTTGFETGNWGLMTAYQMMKLMEQVSIDSDNKTELNTQFAKYNDAGNIYGRGRSYWTCAEYSPRNSFGYSGYFGKLDSDYFSKSGTSSCRPILALDFD